MTDNFINICPNCFADKQSARQCPFCGYEETLDESNPLYIKPRTVLNQQYLIGNVIGHGGFGITYLCWDLKLKRKVAIKEFLPTSLATRIEKTDEENTRYTVTHTGNQEQAFQIGLKKFLKEARILAGFTHENIVRVFDYFESNNTGYIVMEYVGEQNLSQLIKQHPDKRLPVEQALEIFFPILNALKVIHANGIYHQDISLQNIRIVDGKKPVLIDFGAARFIVGELSQSLDRIFKPGYSPVEQIVNNRKNIGPWTDIYACGAVFYAMIMGELPPASIDRLDQDDLIPPKKGVKISSSINNAVLKALSVRIGDRFQTADEFEQALLNNENTIAKKTPNKFLLTAVGGIFFITAMIASFIYLKSQPKVVPPSTKLLPSSESQPSEQAIHDEINPICEIIGIQSSYREGDEVIYSINCSNNEALSRITFRVADSPVKQTWNVSGKKIHNQSSFSTKGWQLNKSYIYLLTVEDQMGNTVKSENSFTVKIGFSQHLKTCEKYFINNNLTIGANGTALECYQEVLKEQPNHAEALVGIKKIEQRLVSLTNNALSNWKLDRAKQYLASLHKVNPKSPHLEQFKQRLASLRYTDNGNGTVTDNKTGLIWLKKANCFGQQNWKTAKRMVAELADGKCGLSDGSTRRRWRLPTIKEWKDMVSKRYGKPAISNAAGTGKWKEGDVFFDIHIESHWSSNKCDKSNSVWVVYLINGRVDCRSSNYPRYIWPVR